MVVVGNVEEADGDILAVGKDLGEDGEDRTVQREGGRQSMFIRIHVIVGSVIGVMRDRSRECMGNHQHEEEEHLRLVMRQN